VHPGVSAAIVTAFEEPEVVARTVRGLLGQSQPPLEVLVVDNHPEARVSRALVEQGLQITPIRSGRNLGYPPACNLAAERAQGEWLLFVNPDTQPEPDLVERLLEATDDDTAIVGAQILLGDGERVNAGDNPLHLTGLSWSGRYGEPRETGSPRDVAVASGAALMIRRADFDRLGGYHEGYFLYHDDVDIAWRARLSGRRVVFCPAAAVRHDFEFGKGAHKWFWLERNRGWTVLSNYSAAALALLAPLLLAAEVGILALALRDGWWREKLRAWAALWRERGELRRWRARVQAQRTVSDAELLRAFTGRIDTPLVAFPGRGVLDPLLEGYRRLAILVLRLAG
jgi:GT2 family glycosyltransferase